MSNIKDFIIRDYNYPIGSLTVVPVISGSEPGEIYGSTGSIWVKSDSVYLKSDYPELASLLGPLGTGIFNFTRPTSNRNQTLESLDNTLFLTQSNGTILYSNTGTSWSTIYTSNSSVEITALQKSTNTYVAVGNSTIQYSNDLITWQSVVGPFSNVTYTDLSYGNNTFVAFTNTGGIALSQDGITWKGYRPPGTALGNAGIFLSSTNTFLRVNSFGEAYTSEDGDIWITRTFGATTNIFTLAQGPVSVFAGGAAGGLRSSTNGLVWAANTSGTTSTINSIVYSPDLSRFVMVGNLGMARYSSTGVTWTAITSGTTSTFFGSAYGNGQGVFVGHLGNIRTSNNFTTFTARVSSTTNTLYTVTFGNNTFVAAGGLSTPYVTTSSDGIAWANQTLSVVTGGIRSIVYGNNLFIVGTTTGQLATSTDAVTWANTSSNDTSTIGSIVYGNGLYNLFTYSGNTRTSTDGFYWPKAPALTTLTELSRVVFANNSFYAMGVSGVGRWSNNGLDWNSLILGTASNNVLDIHYRSSDNRLLFVANGGYIGQATGLVNGGSSPTFSTSIDAPGQSLNSITSNVGTYIITANSGIVYRSNLAAFSTFTRLDSGVTYTSIKDSEHFNNTFILVDRDAGFIGASSNLADYVYSASFDINTEFYVPNVSTSITTADTLSASLFSPTLRVYVKAAHK